jgi:hypothetical protein
MSKKTNRNPQFTAYLPQKVLEALRQEAQKQHRSMNAQLVWCLEQCLGMEADATGRTTRYPQE